MPVLRLLVITVVLGVAVSPAASSSTSPDLGSLVGETQISFGCPGPVRVGGSSCHPWRRFPSARFAIRQVGPGGRPLPQIVRLVVSGANARFRVVLGAGSYLVTPLAQRHIHGGRQLTIRIRPGRVTSVLVRYMGYPQML